MVAFPHLSPPPLWPMSWLLSYLEHSNDPLNLNLHLLSLVVAITLNTHSLISNQPEYDCEDDEQSQYTSQDPSKPAPPYVLALLCSRPSVGIFDRHHRRLPYYQWRRHSSYSKHRPYQQPELIQH